MVQFGKLHHSRMRIAARRRSPRRRSIESGKPDDFDALLLPGGVPNRDKLRIEPTGTFDPAVAENRFAQ
jgi:hypothetical protein